jgi:competence protein ComEC
LRGGTALEWDGVRFEMLHPLPSSYADAALKPNARGCALKITAGGDAAGGRHRSRPGSRAAAARPQRLQADVLLAPHHGSGTSSTPAFLLAVQPSVAVFQVGYRNRYRHPKQEVYERYGAQGVRRLRTDESGAVTIDFSNGAGQGIGIASYRTEHRRYWNGR